MKESTLPVIVNILGKEYKISCGHDERKELINSAQQLDQQMMEIRDSGKVIGNERIAVMAALNIAHELNLLHKQGHFSGNAELGFVDHVTALRHKIESVLDKS